MGIVDKSSFALMNKGTCSQTVLPTSQGLPVVAISALVSGTLAYIKSKLAIPSLFSYFLIRWLLSTGRFPEFRLAERYRAEADQEYQAWAEAAARQRLPHCQYHQARRLSSSRAASRSPRLPGVTTVFY
jgi:hypothetical protein